MTTAERRCFIAAMRCANPQSRHGLRDPIAALVSSVPPRILQLAASSRWISAGLHYLADQTLRNSHRCSGIVYKPALDLVPANRKTGSDRGRQWADFELLSAFLAKFRHPFCLCQDLLPGLQPDRNSSPKRPRNFWLRRLRTAKNRIPATAITAMTTITTRS